MVPTVQKLCRATSHAPRPAVGQNSVKSVKTTGTPPRPTPTTPLSSSSSCA